MNRIAARPSATTEDVHHLYPVILCGGSGKRLWPVSRRSCPKQFQRLCSERSLLQDTVLRVAEGFAPNPPMLLCSEEHRFLAADQLREIAVSPLAIVCEPASRNTAPALAAAAMLLHAHDPRAIMLAMPADHLIGDRATFERAVRLAASAAKDDWLVTFGILPDRPETGYGYIRQGEALDGAAGVHRVSRFIEKPDAAAAARLLETGGHLWNSGIFVFPTKLFLDEVHRLQPALAAACAAAVEACPLDGGQPTLARDSFATAPDISVDYAVMEHTERAAVVPVDMAWSDIGSWHALRDAQERDGQGNVLRGRVLVDEVCNSYVHADGRLVAVVGVDDLVVVDTPDAVLVSSARHAPKIDRLVRSLGDAGAPEAARHTTVVRPWGRYRRIGCGDAFGVTHVEIRPGGTLQIRRPLGEHWIVAGGTARLTRGTEVRSLGENDTFRVPDGTSLHLENSGKTPLHLVEVQVGSNADRDDVVPIDGVYGRV